MIRACSQCKRQRSDMIRACSQCKRKVIHDQGVLAVQAAHAISTNSTSATSRAHPPPPHCEIFGSVLGGTPRVLKTGKCCFRWVSFAYEDQMGCNDAAQCSCTHGIGKLGARHMYITPHHHREFRLSAGGHSAGAQNRQVLFPPGFFCI